MDLKIEKISIRAQKIHGSTLKTFTIIITDFQMEDKIGMLFLGNISNNQYQIWSYFRYAFPKTKQRGYVIL